MPKNAYKKVKLSNAICMWPKLFQAEEYMGKKNFAVTTLLDGVEDPNYKALISAVEATVGQAYPGKPVEQVLRKFKGSRQSWPFREGDDGRITICFKRKEERGAPVVLDQKKQNIPCDAGLPYGGCFVNIVVTVCCYTQNGGGVTSYLEGVQLVREGDPLSGVKSDVKDDFDVVGDAPSADDFL